MKSIKLIGIVCLTLGLGSCYEDKGLYDYREMNRPVVSKGLEGLYNIGLGDSLKIEPEIAWALTDRVNVSYEWSIEGSVVGTAKDLFIPQYGGKIGKNYGTFNIVDKDEGVTYMNPFIVDVTPTYSKGWLILSERNGVSEISYIRPKTVTEDGVSNEVYEEFVDVYRKNTGEELGKNPVKLVENWCEDLTRNGQILVVNRNNSLELDGASMSKVVDTRQEFIGERYPDGFEPVDAIYAFKHSFILSRNGQLYSRIFDATNNFQTGFYNPEPVYVTDSLSIKQVIPSKFTNSYSLLMYDGYNRRFLWVNCYSYYQPGMIGMLSSPGYPEFSDLGNLGDKDLVYSGAYLSSEIFNSGYINILKSDVGQYYIQDLTVKTQMFMSDVTPKYEKIFPGGQLIKPDSDFAVLDKRLYLFFTSDDGLYYYDRATQKVSERPYVSFDGVRIASIHFNKDNTQLAVGLENGKFMIYDITDVALAKGEPVLLYEGKNDFGKIVDVIYKYGTMMNAFY